MIKIRHIGDFSKTNDFFNRVIKKDYYRGLSKLAEQGVAALSAATPKDTGLTAASWGYEIKIGSEKTVITWTNDNIVDGVPIAIIIQYGHATGTGVYVQGVDYINPAIRPIFDKIANEAWKEVTA